MEKIEIKVNGNTVKENSSLSLYEIMKKHNIDKDIPVGLARVNGELKELFYKPQDNDDIRFLEISDKYAMMAYIRSLQFVLIKAVSDIYPKSEVIIQHSLSKGLFGEIYKGSDLVIDDVYDIKARMVKIINEDLVFEKKVVSKNDALDIFSKEGMDDKVSIIEDMSQELITTYKLGEMYDYFYGPMLYSTGQLKYFDLIYYDPGFILRFPKPDKPCEIPRFESNKNLGKIFYEAEKWGDILNISHVGDLNNEIEKGDIVTIVRVAEALHEKKMANIADTINKNRNIKIVCIAGPSSSGKTTFSNRLGIQLRVNGVIPVPISLDDYFVDREFTPRDKYGEYNFETIGALDLKLFNEHLSKLLNNEEIEIPSFNFITGKREWVGNKLRLPSNGVIVIEGIHGLNTKLTEAIGDEHKFKIYISPLTQINMDDHNRIATTDVRIIRRIVRDSLSRGYNAEYTLRMWPSVRRGEDENIFPYQESADIIFNSALIYELAVLKKYALSELYKIEKDSDVYDEARRLIEFLHFFKDVDKDIVPTNSLMREFIGGSCFYHY